MQEPPPRPSPVQPTGEGKKDPRPYSPRGREKRILAQDTAAFFASARYFPSGGRVDARVGVASGWMRGGSVD